MKLSSLNSIVAPEGYEYMVVCPGGWGKHRNLRSAIELALKHGSHGTCQLYLVKEKDAEARVSPNGYITWSKDPEGNTGKIGTMKAEN